MINLPPVGQTLGFSCGPASLRSALLFHGVDVTESRLIKECVCDPKYGTMPDQMIAVARTYLPKSFGRRRLGLSGLRRAIDAGHPVVVLYLESSGRGHYAVVCHVDENVTLMNPQQEGVWEQIFLSSFLDRWKDEGPPHEHVRWGLVVR